MAYPTENATRYVLSNTKACLALLDPGVTMGKGRGGQDSRPSWRKLDNQLEIVQHEVSAFGIVEASRGSGTAHEFGLVKAIDMTRSHRIAHVDSEGCIDGIGKRSVELGMMIVEFGDVRPAEIIHLGGIELENGW